MGRGIRNEDIVFTDNKRLYRKLKPVLGCRLIWKASVVVCPYCKEKLLPYKKLERLHNEKKNLKLKVIRLKKHLLWNCHKAPWYWFIRNKIFNSKKYKNEILESSPRHFYHLIIQKYFTHQSFGKYCRYLILKESIDKS